MSKINSTNILNRKIYKDLIKWKKTSNGETALMIDGARRVGKSFLCEQFAQNEYKSYIIIDFGIVPQDILDLFVYDSANLDLFFAHSEYFISASLLSLLSCVSNSSGTLTFNFFIILFSFQI